MPFAADKPTPSAGRFVPDEVAHVMLNPQDDPEAMLREREAITGRRKAAREREEFLRENVQPGVPMDLDTGLPAGTRARLSFENDIDKQAEILTQQGLSVRKSKDGKNLIVRQGDKEILLHPKNATLSGGDVAGATFPLLKTGAAAGIAYLTGGLSLPKQAALMGGGMALAEAAGEGSSRLAAGQSLEGVGGDAMREGTINAALPLAAGAAGATLKKGGELLRRGAGELEKRLPDAARRLGVPTTAGEETGSKLLVRLEKAAATPEDEAMRQGSLRASQDRALGLSGRGGVLSESEVAAKTQPVFAEAEQTAAKGVRRELSDAERAAQAQIQAQLDSGLTPSTLTQTEGGKFIRGKVEDAVSKFQEQSAKNYGKLYEQAAKEDLSIPTQHVTALADKIKEKDPQGAVEALVPEIRRIFGVEGALTKPLQKAEPTGLLDEFGKPIMTAEIPPKVTLPQAIELRAVVNGQITRDEAVGKIPNRYLEDLAKALTAAIDDGVKAGSPELRVAFEAARKHYADNIGKFKAADIAKLFVEPESGRALGNDEIVASLFRGRGNLDALRRMRDVLEPADFKLLVRQGLNSIIEESRAGAQMVDAGAFLRRLGGLSDEASAELLGPLAKTLRQDASLMARAQGSKVPIDELEDALASGTGAARLLERAIAREKAYEQQFKSTVQQRLRNGVLDPKTANEDRFVTWLTESPDVSVTDVRQALTQIAAKSPTAAEEVRQRALLNVLETNGVRPPIGKATTGEVFDMDPRKLADLLKPGPQREKLQAILGSDGVQFLDDLATYAEATAKRVAGETGRQVSPEVLAKEVTSGAAGFARNAISATVDVATKPLQVAGGKALRNEAVRRFVTTGELPKLNRTVRAGILTTPEVLRANDAVNEGKP